MRQSRNEFVVHDRRVKSQGSSDHSKRLLAALEQQPKAEQILQDRLVELDTRDRDRQSGSSSNLSSFLMARGSAADIKVNKLPGGLTNRHR